MKATLRWFILGSIVGWIVLAVISFLRAETSGLICSSIGCAICFVPTCLSLVLAHWSADRKGANQLMAVFGGMALRMLFVLGVGLAAFFLIPWFRESKDREYIYWGNILISYLFSLGLETFLSVRNRQDGQIPKEVGN